MMMKRLLIYLFTILLAVNVSGQKKSESPEEIILKAKAELSEYNFDKVLSHVKSYNQAIKSTDGDSLSKPLAHSARVGKDMLERVQDVVIVDSLIVPKKDFFRYYRLSPTVGSFKKGSIENLNSPIYVSGDGMSRMYASPSAEDSLLIVSSDIKLVNGVFETSESVERFEGIDDMAYPWLMPDSETLYFAGNGEQSLGGWDIFITRRSSMFDKYLQPQNIGMPFNSPYDDYLMVIDETTGVGWWATDRNQIPDSITIYTFIPTELRSNIPADSPDIKSRAFIRSIQDTQPDGFSAPDIDGIIRRQPAVSGKELY